MTPFLKFWLGVNLPNLLFCFLCGWIFGIVWGFVFFATVGFGLGWFLFSQWRGEEFWLLRNLGYSRKGLFLRSFQVNLMIISIPLSLILIFSGCITTSHLTIFT